MLYSDNAIINILLKQPIHHIISLLSFQILPFFLYWLDHAFNLVMISLVNFSIVRCQSNQFLICFINEWGYFSLIGDQILETTISPNNNELGYSIIKMLQNWNVWYVNEVILRCYEKSNLLNWYFKHLSLRINEKLANLISLFSHSNIMSLKIWLK